MKRFCGIVVLMMVVGAVSHGESPQASGQAQIPDQHDGDISAETNAIVAQYCVGCHNERLKTAGLILDMDGISNIGQHAELWEKVVRKVRSGAMPPNRSRRPESVVLSRWVAGLEEELDRAAAARPNPGRVGGIHRLNRAEYQNVIRDLFDLDVDAEALLPVDESGYGFDNNADVLSVSPTLLERYMLAAYKVSRLAMGTPVASPTPVAYMNSPLLWQEDRVSPDLPFGSRGGIAARHTFPVDGEYEINIRISRKADPTRYVKELRGTEPLEVRVNHELVRVIQPTTSGGGDRYSARGAAPDTSPLSFRLPMTAGPHLLGISFVADMEQRLPIDARPPRPSLSSFFFQQYGNAPQIAGVQIIGPFNPGDAGDTPSRRRILVCQPVSAAEEEPCARDILTHLVARAYRGASTEADIETLMTAYRRGRANGDFETGLQWAIESLLVQPGFLFRVVRDPVDAQAGAAYSLSDSELASRLSFFLWSSLPDDELLAVAERGTLSDPVVLEQQVQRMLSDSRAAALTKNFAGQWLWLRKLQYLSPNPNLFPEFEENLRQSLRQETEMFIESQMREDHSISDLLTADYTFLNERLAEHYEIQNVYGNQFRRVTLDDERRFGLLGQGSILAVTSYANRTSPVIRGLWLLENFLGTPPPPPPPDVPALEENGEGAAPTTVRARLEQHRSNPACATCHRLMDPLGFALEHFDALGRWRTIDAESKEPIDASGVLVDGTKFDGPVEFRHALMARRTEFIETVTEKLLTYALGRGTEYYDRPAIRQILREAAKDDYRWSSIIRGIIKSPPFQMRVVPTEGASLQAAHRVQPAGRE